MFTYRSLCLMWMVDGYGSAGAGGLGCFPWYPEKSCMVCVSPFSFPLGCALMRGTCGISAAALAPSVRLYVTVFVVS